MSDYRSTLTSCGLRVLGAHTGASGLAAVKRNRSIQIAIIDLDLPDMSGLSLLKSIHSYAHPSAIITSCHPSVESALAAGRLGADDFITKPLSRVALLALIQRLPSALAKGHRSSQAQPFEPPTCARRWARAVLVVAVQPDDIALIDDWGRRAGASRGAIKAWCLAHEVTANDSLDFARLLRLVIQGAGRLWNPAHWLNVIDKRTRARLLARGGLNANERLPSLETFLHRQHYVQQAVLLEALRHELSLSAHGSCALPSITQLKPK